MFLERWSSSLPGVAIAICAPLSRASICGVMLTPPYNNTVFTLLLSLCASESICCASSLVGASITACSFFTGSIVCSIGSRNANVFPLPVLLLTTRSFLLRSIGIAFSCTSVGLSYFSFCRDCNSSGFRFNSSNCIFFLRTYYSGFTPRQKVIPAKPVRKEQVSTKQFGTA